MNKSVLLVAPVESRSGYGNHARDVAQAIIESDGYDLQIVATSWGSCPNNALEFDKPAHNEIDKRIIKSEVQITKPDIFIQLTIPNEFQPNQGRYNIGFTAGIETDVCAVDWVEGCNRMDHVIATSEHSLNVLKDTVFDERDKQSQKVIRTIKFDKNKVKSDVLFEGVHPEVYHKTSTIDKDLKQLINNTVKEKFAFLFVGHWLQGKPGQDRKDISMMIETFIQTFIKTPPSKRPALILKTSSAGFSVTDREELFRKVNVIRSKFKNPPNIYILHGNFTDSEMNSLYNHPKIKAMISFTKGEGFGRPLLEFTTTGKPVIASGWSGQVDFLDKDSSILLPGELTPVHNSSTNKWIIKGSKWFTVNYSFASTILKQVFDNYDKYKARGVKQKKITETQFSFDKMKEKLISILDNITIHSNSDIGVGELKMPKLKLKTKKKKDASKV